MNQSENGFLKAKYCLSLKRPSPRSSPSGPQGLALAAPLAAHLPFGNKRDPLSQHPAQCAAVSTKSLLIRKPPQAACFPCKVTISGRPCRGGSVACSLAPDDLPWNTEPQGLNTEGAPAGFQLGQAALESALARDTAPPTPVHLHPSWENVLGGWLGKNRCDGTSFQHSARGGALGAPGLQPLPCF